MFPELPVPATRPKRKACPMCLASRILKNKDAGILPLAGIVLVSCAWISKSEKGVVSLENSKERYLVKGKGKG